MDLCTCVWAPTNRQSFCEGFGGFKIGLHYYLTLQVQQSFPVTVHFLFPVQIMYFGVRSARRLRKLSMSLASVLPAKDASFLSVTFG